MANRDCSFEGEHDRALAAGLLFISALFCTCRHSPDHTPAWIKSTVKARLCALLDRIQPSITSCVEVENGRLSQHVNDGVKQGPHGKSQLIADYKVTMDRAHSVGLVGVCIVQQ